MASADAHVTANQAQKFLCAEIFGLIAGGWNDLVSWNAYVFLEGPQKCDPRQAVEALNQMVESKKALDISSDEERYDALLSSLEAHRQKSIRIFLVL